LDPELKMYNQEIYKRIIESEWKDSVSDSI